jgi:hypothetical protein
MSKYHEILFKNDNITLSIDNKGLFWLYDKVVSQNLSMNAKSEREAFIEALKYYQDNYPVIKNSYFALKGRIEAFMEGEGWKEIDEEQEAWCAAYR